MNKFFYILLLVFAFTGCSYEPILMNKKYKFLGLMFHPERYNISQIEINKFVKKFFK